MIAVDSNIFMRWLLNDDKEQADAIAALVRKFEKDGERLWASDSVIAEVVEVLESVYDVSPKDVCRYVESLLDVQTFEFENRERLLRAVELHRAHQVDFVDCTIVASSKDEGIATVVSYDRDFRKMPIKAIGP